MNVNNVFNAGGALIKNPNYAPGNGQPEYITSVNANPLAEGFFDDSARGNNAIVGTTKDGLKAAKYNITQNRWEDLDTVLAEKQSNWEKTWNSAKQTVWNEIVLGTGIGLADLCDFVIGGIIRKAVGEENDYSNPVSEYLKGVQEQYKEDNPIYMTTGVNIANGGLNNWGWYMNNMPSVASTLTLLIPSTGVTKGLSYLGKSTKFFKGVGNARKFITAIDKVDKAADIAKAEGKTLGTLGKFSQWVNNENTIRTANQAFNLGGNAMLQRVMENYQESGQVYSELLPKSTETINNMSDEEYAVFLDKNKDVLEGVDTTNKEDVAKRIAKASADETFKIDMINGIFDAFQMYGLKNISRFKNAPMRAAVRRKHLNSIKYPGKTEKEIDEILSKRSFAQKAKDKLSDLTYGSGILISSELSEGAEEAINYIAQEEGLNYGNILLNSKDADKNDLKNRLWKYAQAPQLWESAFWGVMGGVVFQSGGSALARLNNAIKTKYNERKNKQDNTTKEQVKQTSWGDAFKDSEIEERKQDIEGRATAYNTLASEIEEITNNNKLSKEEKAIERKKAFDKHDRSLLMSSMWSGNYDLTRAYLESDEVKQAMVASGLLTQEQANERQRNILTLADRLEESFNRNMRVIGNAMRGKDEKTGADYSEVPYEYFKIIAAVNMGYELSAEDYQKAIDEYQPTIGSEEKRLADELKSKGIDYKQQIRAFIIAQQLGQIEANLEAAKKTKKQGRTDEDIDSSTLSGQTTIKELNNRKKILLNMLQTTMTGVATPIDENLVNRANLITVLRAAAATERDANDLTGYKYNKNGKRFKDVDNALVKAYEEGADNWATNAKALSALHSDFGHLTYNQFSDAYGHAKVVDENIGRALGVGGTIDDLNKRSSILLKAYAAVTNNEIEKNVALSNIAKDRDTVRTLAHNEHNIMNRERGVVLEYCNNVLKALSKKYSDEYGDLSEEFAYGTLNKEAREKLKSVLSNEDLMLYDDMMKVISLNARSVTQNNRNNTSAINTLLPELIKDALYESSYKEYEDVDISILDRPSEEKQSETHQNQTQTTKTNNVSGTATQSQQSGKASQAGASNKQQMQSQNQQANNAQTQTSTNNNVDFTRNTSGNVLPMPRAIVVLDADGKPTSLKQLGSSVGSNPNINKSYVHVNKVDDYTYELDYKSDTTRTPRRLNDEEFTNSELFSVKTAIQDGGVVTENPKVVLDDDGNVIEIRKGVIDIAEETEEPETSSTGGSTKPNANQTTNEESTEEEIIESFNNYESEEGSAIDDVAPDDNYDSETLSDNITADMMAYIRNKHELNEDYDENELLSLLTEKYKDKVDEDELKTVFNKFASFGRRLATRHKLNIKELEDITNFVKQSVIEESAVDGTAADKAREALDSAMNSILESFAKRTYIGEHEGKIVLSLENLLRYANDIAGDKYMAEFLYDKFKSYFAANRDKYILTEGRKINKSDIINKASMTSEERLNNITSPNGRTLYIPNVRSMTEKQREEVYGVLDSLRPGDELTYEIDKHVVTIYAKGKVVGTCYEPRLDGNGYVSKNKGWIVDVPVSSTETGDLERLFTRLLCNPNNEESISKVIQALETLRYTEYIDAEGELNPEYKQNAIAVLNAISDAGVNLNQYTETDGSDESKLELVSYLNNIYRGVKEASEQLLTKQNLTREEYNEAIVNRRKASIHNWFERLRDSYTTASILINNPNAKIVIDKASQGGLIITNEEEAKPVNEKGVIGSEHKDKIEIVVQSITEPGIAYSTDGTRKPVSDMSSASTFVSIPRSDGTVALVHAYPQLISVSHLKGEVKEIQNEILNEFERLLKEWSDDSNKSTRDIESFINLLCSGRYDKSGIRTNNPLFRGLRVTPLTRGFKGIQISYYADNKIQRIQLFDEDSKGNKASVIKFEGQKARAFKKDANVRSEVIKQFKDVINNNLRYNLEFDHVRGSASLKGVAKRNTKGKFIIQIPGGKPHTFSSYKSFILDNGIVAVTTKSTNGKTNFYRKGESDNKFDNVQISYKIDTGNTTPIEKKVVTKPSSTTTITKEIIFYKKGDKLVDILNHKQDHKNLVEEILELMLNNTQLNYLKKSKLYKDLLNINIIFDKNFTGIAEYHSNTDKVLIGPRMIDALNDDDVIKHERVFRHLLHECIHKKIDELDETEQEILFNGVREIFDAFVEANEKDGLPAEKGIRLYEYVNAKSKKDYRTNGKINDAGLEEFLIESIIRPELIQRLNNIIINDEVNRLKIGSTKSKNLLQQLLAIIAKMFGLNINKGSLLEKEYNMFKEAGIFDYTQNTNNITNNKENKRKDNAEQQAPSDTKENLNVKDETPDISSMGDVTERKDGDITSAVTEKDGVTTTKYTNWRKNKSGEVKPITNSRGIVIDISSIYEDSIPEDDDIEEVRLAELREKDGKFTGTVWFTNGIVWQKGEVVFNKDPRINDSENKNVNTKDDENTEEQNDNMFDKQKPSNIQNKNKAIEDITQEDVDEMNVDDVYVDESVIEESEVEAPSYSYVRDRINEDGRDAFENLVNSGAIQIKC